MVDSIKINTFLFCSLKNEIVYRTWKKYVEKSTSTELYIAATFVQYLQVESKYFCIAFKAFLVGNLDSLLLKQGHDTPSPADTPYSCRQRTSANSLSNSMHEMNEMEKGVLLQNGNPSLLGFDYYLPNNSNYSLRSTDYGRESNF